jgi:23S rRNA pseudouridine1911/1915/1917 synthase
VEPDKSGQRLDLYLQQHLPGYSRSRLQEWIRRERVLVDGRPQKPSFVLRGGETVLVQPEAPPPLKAFAEEIPLEIPYIDDDVIAVNKPAGMTVHAGAGAHSGTLTNALLHRFGQLSNVSGEDRPGIVHRIDRDTSGVLLVARHDAAHRSLAAQFAERRVEKTYLALVQGKIVANEGRIDRRITRDPVRRTRMTAKLESGRTALTFYRVLERFDRFTYTEIRIATGRTHQIRVHMASIGHPVAGDTLYGGAAAGEGRFFLHAYRIRFRQPSTAEERSVEAPLPPELQDWLARLRYNTGRNPSG